MWYTSLWKGYLVPLGGSIRTYFWVEKPHKKEMKETVKFVGKIKYKKKISKHNLKLRRRTLTKQTKDVSNVTRGILKRKIVLRGNSRKWWLRGCWKVLIYLEGYLNVDVLMKTTRYKDDERALDSRKSFHMTPPLDGPTIIIVLISFSLKKKMRKHRYCLSVY